MIGWLEVVAPLVIRISSVLTIIPLGVLLYRKPAFPYALSLLPWYIGADVFLVVLGAIARIHFRNNIPIFHLSTLFDISLILLCYARILPEIKKYILVTWGLFLIIWLVSALTIDYYLINLNTSSRLMGNTSVIVLSIYYIMHTLSLRTIEKDPTKNPVLLFSFTIFIYYSCSNMILFQELPRYHLLIFTTISSRDFEIISLIWYPLIRAIQIALLVYSIILLPTTLTPRRALPRWLRFRLGWRPPAAPLQYRVLSEHLIK